MKNDDARRIPHTTRLSRRTHAVLSRNISRALGNEAVLMELSLFGVATTWIAVFADTLAVLPVVANGFRRIKLERPTSLPDARATVSGAC